MSKTPENLYDSHEPPPETMEDDPEFSVEVDVFVDDECFSGYYHKGAWWIDYGGMTIGNRKTSCDEVDGWRYKKKK
jgi:hypothetical protein